VGMVGYTLRHRGEELLGQRGGLAKYAETGSSFGIPLLHPWANRLDGFTYEAAGRRVELDPGAVRLDENGLPIHGLVTASPHWEVLSSAADEGSARLSALFDFAARDELLENFPYPHELRVDVELSGARLQIVTTLHASGDQAVPVSFGWHPYLTLPGVPRPDWLVELPVRRRAVLDDRGIPTGETEPIAPERGPLGSREFDDLFTELEDDPVFALAGGGRRLEAAFDDAYPVAQVYAPARQDFICYEPMTAPTNALVSGEGLRTVEPGASLSAGFSIVVLQG
jgi:aldose 1-epimerase